MTHHSPIVDNKATFQNSKNHFNIGAWCGIPIGQMMITLTDPSLISIVWACIVSTVHRHFRSYRQSIQGLDSVELEQLGPRSLIGPSSYACVGLYVSISFLKRLRKKVWYHFGSMVVISSLNVAKYLLKGQCDLKVQSCSALIHVPFSAPSIIVLTHCINAQMDWDLGIL